MPADADARLPGATAGAASQLDTFRHYRHLTVELAISQFKLRYTGSVLGYFWSLLKPAMIFAIMYFIFVDLFKIQDGTEFYGMQVLLGIVVWTFFAECTSSAMQAIASNGGLIRKAYFPRSILVIAASLSALFTFVINLLIVFVIAVGLHQIDISLTLGIERRAEGLIPPHPPIMQTGRLDRRCAVLGDTGGEERGHVVEMRERGQGPGCHGLDLHARILEVGDQERHRARVSAG